MKKILLIICVTSTTFVKAQDVAFAHKIVDTLTSPYFWGRGYTNNGMLKASQFLATAFKNYGLQCFSNNNYFQIFNYPVNTFDGKMELSINNKKLIAGENFIVSPESKGVNAKGNLLQVDSSQYLNKKNNIIIKLQDKLTWDVSSIVKPYTLIFVDKKSINNTPINFNINIENKLITNFTTANVCGFVKGTNVSDSFIFITAHYDHLGGMGENTYFPGANDNASGIALLLNLAHYYAQHPQKYSIAFICFAGEEAGLLGSKFYTQHPLSPLKNIKFLINTDLAGTGEEGITVVNATVFTKEFEMLKAANNECKKDGSKMLVAINARGKAANSDHYFFTEKGVPSFFFYTLGGIKAYHDVFDKAITLPLNEHENLFKLLIKFNEKLMSN